MTVRWHVKRGIMQRFLVSHPFPNYLKQHTSLVIKALFYFRGIRTPQWKQLAIKSYNNQEIEWSIYNAIENTNLLVWYSMTLVTFTATIECWTIVIMMAPGWHASQLIASVIGPLRRTWLAIKLSKQPKDFINNKGSRLEYHSPMAQRIHVLFCHEEHRGAT